MFRVAIDFSLVQDHPHVGIASHAQGLYKALVRQTDPNEWHFVAIAGHGQDLQCHGLPPDADVIRLPRRRLGKASAVASHQINLPVLLAKHHIDIYHAPGISVAVSMPTAPCWSTHSVKRVITLHDLIPLRFPQIYPPGRFSIWRHQLFFRLSVSWMIRNAWIITSSQSSAVDIRKHFSVESSRLSVIPLSVNPELITAAATDNVLVDKLRDQVYILHVGTGHKNKNIPTLLQVFAEVRRQLPEFNAKLALVGGYPMLQEQVLQYCPDVQQHIVQQTQLSTVEMAHLYKSAAVLLFPSIYEGFGLPPLEALAIGCPVVSSNASSLPEVVGDAAISCPPYDVACMSNATALILRDPSLAKAMRLRGKLRAAQFSWDTIVSKTLEVYHLALSSK